MAVSTCHFITWLGLASMSCHRGPVMGIRSPRATLPSLYNLDWRPLPLRKLMALGTLPHPQHSPLRAAQQSASEYIPQTRKQCILGPDSIVCETPEAGPTEPTTTELLYSWPSPNKTTDKKLLEGEMISIGFHVGKVWWPW